ncbi:MAG: Gfo/Idh/MocA family oxidoreductase [Puniceicoccaceae bacterium]
MSELDLVKCGVIGVGSLGQHHARIYAALPNVELVGITDADPARAAEISEKHGTRVFESPEELAASCEAVSIVVPTDLHSKVAIPVMQAGAHVLIEKPICATLEETHEVLAVAKQTGRLVQVGHIEHFNPVMSYLEENVQNPLYITADRLAPFVMRGTEVGVVLDLMIHDIGIIQQLVRSPIERVDSVGVNVLSGKEDIANARIQFANGCVANINTSRVSTKKVREIRVFQETGYISLNFMEQSGHLVRKNGLALEKEEIPIEKDEPLKLELAAFVDCVKEKRTPKVGGEEGATALDVAMQITDQIRAHSASIRGNG